MASPADLAIWSDRVADLADDLNSWQAEEPFEPPYCDTQWVQFASLDVVDSLLGWSVTADDAAYRYAALLMLEEFVRLRPDDVLPGLEDYLGAPSAARSSVLEAVGRGLTYRPPLALSSASTSFASKLGAALASLSESEASTAINIVFSRAIRSPSSMDKFRAVAAQQRPQLVPVIDAMLLKFPVD